MGTLGQSGSGRLRLVKKEKKVAKRLKTVNVGSSGATGGISSSLAFTPVQGFELAKPGTDTGRKKSDKYFSNTGTFTQIRPGT